MTPIKLLIMSQWNFTFKSLKMENSNNKPKAFKQLTVDCYYTLRFILSYWCVWSPMKFRFVKRWHHFQENYCCCVITDHIKLRIHLSLLPFLLLFFFSTSFLIQFALIQFALQFIRYLGIRNSDSFIFLIFIESDAESKQQQY